jgi:inner membrane protein
MKEYPNREEECSTLHGVVAWKFATIALVVLLLWIPLTLIRSLLWERQDRQRAAIEEINNSWGVSQTVIGPILSIPVDRVDEATPAHNVSSRVGPIPMPGMDPGPQLIHLLPAKLFVDGRIDPRLLHRGIFEAVVYHGKLELSGEFEPVDSSPWNLDPENVRWEDATISLGVSDLRGTREPLKLMVGEETMVLTAGSRFAQGAQGVQCVVGDRLRTEESLKFSMSLKFNGSGRIAFAPVAKQMEVRLSSSWPDPSFAGAFLPSERIVTADGFEAVWHVSSYQRSMPEWWSNHDRRMGLHDHSFQESLFGVDLIQVVDTYRLVERSTKYGLLFIVLVFTVFFLFEVLSPVRVHPFRYLLVGFAVCLFYLGLLSLSEFVSFGLAFFIGAGASTVLIVFYSVSTLNGGRPAVIIAAELCVTYLFLFVILCLQDYSLLVGTIGLFMVLGAVMYLTRNIDWYAGGAVARTSATSSKHPLKSP